MIEVTQEQVQALGKPETTPPRVVNPQTKELFVWLNMNASKAMTNTTTAPGPPRKGISCAGKLARCWIHSEKTYDLPSWRHHHDPLPSRRGKTREETARRRHPSRRLYAKLKHFLVAEITGNLAAASDRAGFFIDVSTPEGKATGLDQNSVVCCLFLSTVAEAAITKVVGQLSNAMKAQLDAGLKAALQLP